MGLIVQNLDGSVIYNNVTVINIDQASGVAILSQSPLNPLIDLVPATATTPGGVSTTTQQWSGDKTFLGNLTAQSLTSLSSSTVIGSDYTSIVSPDNLTVVGTDNSEGFWSADSTEAPGPGTLTQIGSIRDSSQTGGYGEAAVQVVCCYGTDPTDPSQDVNLVIFYAVNRALEVTTPALQIGPTPCVGGTDPVGNVFTSGLLTSLGSSSPSPTIGTAVTGGTPGDLLGVDGSGNLANVPVLNGLALTSGSLGLQAQSGTGPPPDGYGWPGAIWFDVTNPDAPVFYYYS